MEGMWFGSLLDLLARQAGTPKRPEKPGNAKAKSGRLGPARRPSPFRPLVAEDRLFFLPPVRSADARTSPPQGADSTAMLDAGMAEVFRRAFRDAWLRIPAEDRGRLLHYWREDLRPALDDDPYPPAPRPLIQLTDSSRAAPVCDRFGHVLTFSTALVAQAPDSLPDVILRTLTQTYRYATRHWALVEEQIERPLARWERRHGAKATASERAKRVRELEAAFRRKHDEEVAEWLRRWGIAEPSPSRQRTARGRKATISAAHRGV